MVSGIASSKRHAAAPAIVKQESTQHIRLAPVSHPIIVHLLELAIIGNLGGA
jgi:hypothetical protein